MLTVEVNDEHFHQDILSDDVKRVHPDLPLNGTPEERREYQHRRDMDAYCTIKSSFPLFTPPSGTQGISFKTTDELKVMECGGS